MFKQIYAKEVPNVPAVDSPTNSAKTLVYLDKTLLIREENDQMTINLQPLKKNKSKWL